MLYTEFPLLKQQVISLTTKSLNPLCFSLDRINCILKKYIDTNRVFRRNPIVLVCLVQQFLAVLQKELRIYLNSTIAFVFLFTGVLLASLFFFIGVVTTQIASLQFMVSIYHSLAFDSHSHHALDEFRTTTWHP